MRIDAAEIASGNAGPAQAAVGKKLGEDDFMKIFLKQMTLQNPTKPMETSEMMQQLSQLTSLQSNKGLKESIEKMGVAIGESQVVNATQMIGKEAVVASDVSPLTASGGLKGAVVVPAAASSVTVDISDKTGKVVKTLNLPSSGAGVVDFAWDGLDDEGKPMSPDFYTIAAKATIDGHTGEIPTAGYFKVNSVTMDRQTSNVILNVDGIGGVGIGDVIKFLA